MKPGQTNGLRESSNPSVQTPLAAADRRVEGHQAYLRDGCEGHGMGHQGLAKSQPLCFVHVLQGDTKHQLMVITADKAR